MVTMQRQRTHTVRRSGVTREPFHYRPWVLSAVLLVLVVAYL